MTEFLSNVTSTCHSSIFICRHSRAVDLSPMTCAINKQPPNYLNRNAPRTSFALALYAVKLCHSWTFPRALACASAWFNKQQGTQKYIFLGVFYPNTLNQKEVLLLFAAPQMAFTLHIGSTWSLPHAKHFMLTSKGRIQTLKSNMHKLLESKRITLENKKTLLKTCPNTNWQSLILRTSLNK